MALPKLTTDLNVIQGLPDTPSGVVGGLTAQQVKVKFDTAGLAIQSYLNTTSTGLVDSVQTALDAKVNSISPTLSNATLNGVTRITRDSSPTQYIEINNGTSGNIITSVSPAGNPKSLGIISDLGNITLSTNAIERMRVDSSGNVGVGTISPGYKLDVNGTGNFTGDLTAPTQAVDNNSTKVATTAFVLNQASSTTPANNGTAAVGTSTRYARADHVHATDTTRAPLASPTFTGIVNLPLSTDTSTPSNLPITFAGGSGSSDLRVSSSKLTFNPSTNVLTVGGQITGNVTSGNGLNLVTTDSTGSANIGGTLLFGGHDGSSANRTYATIGGLKENGTVGNYASYLSFQTRQNGGSLTEQVRIDSNGTVYFDTTTLGALPTGGAVGSGVYGSAFYPTTNGRTQLLMATNVPTSSALIAFYNTNGNVGSIQTSGSATTYATSSDYRLKEDFQDFNGTELLNKIQVYDYAWKVDETRSYGVKAHELQEVVPYAVTGEKDGEEMQGVDYSHLVPILIKAVQELTQELNELKSKN